MILFGTNGAWEEREDVIEYFTIQVTFELP